MGSSDGPKCSRAGNKVNNCFRSRARGMNHSLPVDGEGWGGVVSPLSGRPAEAEFIPIEALGPGDFVFGHDGSPQRVLRTIQRTYRGVMIGIRNQWSEQTLWLTAEHRVSRSDPHDILWRRTELATYSKRSLRTGTRFAA